MIGAERFRPEWITGRTQALPEDIDGIDFKTEVIERKRPRGSSIGPEKFHKAAIPRLEIKSDRLTIPLKIECPFQSEPVAIKPSRPFKIRDSEAHMCDSPDHQNHLSAKKLSIR